MAVVVRIIPSEGLFKFVKTGFLLFMILALCLVSHINIAHHHQHTLANGSIVEHAHPYRPDPGNPPGGQDHQHCESEFLLYALISDSPAFSEANCMPSWDIHYEELDRIIGQEQKPFFNHPVSSCLLRAPPVVASC